MSNKQGQQTKTGNQDSQGNQPHQEATKRKLQEQGGDAAQQQGQGSDSQKKGSLPGSQKDKNGKLG